MAVDVLLGLQWGDEGKGKIVDVMAPRYDVIARFQGGPNAGHTLVIDGKKHVLHQVPSGIFHTHIQNVVGNGVVLDPVIFRRELEGLRDKGIDPGVNLFVSKKAQLILPTHRLLDAAYEQYKGDAKIGSTLRGIGPTYQDKYARVGLRVGDIQADDFRQKYDQLVDRHRMILDYYHFDYSALADAEAEFFQAVDYLRALQLTNSEYLINDALTEGRTVLAEGAQGSLLDIDFGSYPFVTSSSTMAAGACTGLGIAPARVGEVFGIFKAYCTRVGSGPFPTELNDEVGERIRQEGHEFGATTGRSRRCGWLDLPALKYAAMINGATQLLMMKADVLNSFETINVCTRYRLADGTETDQLPYDLCTEPVTPLYETLPGWQQSLQDCHQFDDLPEALLQYVAFIESYLNLPITLVSVGPDRAQTILRESADVR
ncbi:adenylosuccinate synthase [Catalinimonas alkaloidigena]|uniref:Adenylosuccinate synthetase n=1 Tax=Catalinimonas alkaloidigena TaxID=1075417 RepID=A0A1G9IXU7_9BACT|nr:adenylosuccinate synthase [Catalinimonas alkaloidigena]SDL30088.1 adenylosuccinate synthase [Catalinimonas alkaloidigena]